MPSQVNMEPHVSRSSICVDHCVFFDCVCMFMDVQVHVCSCTCEKKRRTSGVFLQELSTLISETLSLTDLELEK